MPTTALRHVFLATLACCCLALLPRSAGAAIASGPMHWSRPAFSGNDQAVEHLTIRARAGAHDTFIRFAIANAGFKRGELTVTLRQESSAGTIYARQTFDKTQYRVHADHFGIRAGKHTVDLTGGQLVLHLDFGNVIADATMSAWSSTFAVSDRSGGGYVARNLLVPIGKLAIKATDSATRTVDLAATGFAVHEASTVTAHQVYDRSVQVHSLSGGNYLVLDYIVLPSSRGNRPLGFAVVSGKGKTFVGEVQKETRENEKPDGSNGYKVPYLVSALGKRGEARAAIRLTGERQVAREDDLADLNFVLRKAVAALMHPVTYTLKAEAVSEVQLLPAEPPVVLTGAVRYKYSQVR